jgi:hypothetical protein
MKPQLPDSSRTFTAGEKFSLLAVENRLRSAEWLKPAAGFSRRWLARIKQERAVAQRVRAGWLLVGNLAAALLVFGLLLSQLGQPASWLTQAVESINSSLAVAETAVSVSLNVIQTFPVLIFYPLIALMLVVMLWGMLIKRSFAFQGESE